MRAIVASVAGALAVASSVAFAALWAHFTRGETGELAAFTVWSLPLGVMLAWFGARPRVSLRWLWTRAPLTGVVGLLFGFILTLIGGLLLGGWMNAWDFPVFFCWSAGATLGALVAGALYHQFSWSAASVGVVPTTVVIGALWWVGTRPQPAVLITYRDDPNRDAAQFVLDSVLSRPHESGRGTTLRWAYHSYSRGSTADGAATALIVLDRAADRDSIRFVLAGHPLVASVVDTMIER